MHYMSGNEIRAKFIHFFQERGHLYLPSASLIPQDDPTLLLIGAGMAPFKPFFTGKLKPPSPRVTTCQKCVRTGDIENVGRTARHHTYFEMLGNFSFGDYFKQEVIPWSWEFLTQVMGLPAEKLWITIYPKDDEAYQIWHDVVGVPDERIVRLEENFWEIGTGPCGPDSEIHIDLGPERGCGRPDCKPGCDCDRFLEIWNLVFTQFNKNEDGSYTPLKSKNIDTGCGLERLASVIQGKASNFETDLLFPLIQYAAQVAGLSYGQTPAADVSLKVIADHARSLTFMIGDGILPSNEGRGYVLRRILRRAVRHGRLLGIEEPFLAGAVDVVIQLYGSVYTNLAEKRDYIQKVVAMEEGGFSRTLKQGSELLSAEIARLKEQGRSQLDGEAAFRLNDTFGFPWELTAEILAESGLTMDKAGFDAALEAQKQRARAARDDKAGRLVLYDTRGLDLAALKIDETATSSKLLRLYAAAASSPIQVARDGEAVALICSVCPFHPEGGGQLGDVGWAEAPAGKLSIQGCRKLPDGSAVLLGTVEEGSLSCGDQLRFTVDRERKAAIARNHTATHLLQAALRQVLGSHVNQAGSYVGPDRLRFDFSHFSPLTPAQLEEVELLVNQKVLAALPVDIREMPIAQAQQLGATALFGEKYGEIVRVVTVPGFSRELCGGVHVGNTAQLGLFKIISEASSGAGVRRIEAVTGLGALEHVREAEGLAKNVANQLKCRLNLVPERLAALQGELKAAQKHIQELQGRLDREKAGSAARLVQDVKGVKLLVQQVEVEDMEALRKLGDQLRDKTGGVVVLAAEVKGKVNLLAMAAKEAVGRGAHSGLLVKELARLCGGGGGGRPDMAQAGAKDGAKLGQALAAAADILGRMVH